MRKRMRRVLNINVLLYMLDIWNIWKHALIIIHIYQSIDLECTHIDQIRCMNVFNLFITGKIRIHVNRSSCLYEELFINLSIRFASSLAPQPFQLNFENFSSSIVMKTESESHKVLWSSAIASSLLNFHEENNDRKKFAKLTS